MKAKGIESRSWRRWAGDIEVEEAATISTRRHCRLQRIPPRFRVRRARREIPMARGAGLL